MNLKRVSQLGGLSGLLLLTVGASLVLLNPKPSEYEEYATQTLITYLKDDVCVENIPIFGGFLKTRCAELVDRNQDEIQQFIIGNTERENYYFFSLYRTRLSVADFLPTYEFETLGIFQRFYTYREEEL